ncbi:MAG: hypothetical protein P8020_11485 [Acidobacteriota bacterium]|jgi:ABC-type transporter Mla subunit MlaD
MSINDPTAITILVFIMAGLVLIQTVGLLFALGKLSSQVRSAEQSVVEIANVIRGRVAEANALLKYLSGMQTRLEDLASHSNQLIDATGDRIAVANDHIAGLLELATGKVDESGRSVEYVLAQFMRQTTQLTRQVHHPTKRVSAVLKGVQVGLKTLLSRERSVPTQDEEAFI